MSVLDNWEVRSVSVSDVALETETVGEAILARPTCNQKLDTLDTGYWNVLNLGKINQGVSSKNRAVNEITCVPELT